MPSRVPFSNRYTFFSLLCCWLMLSTSCKLNSMSKPETKKAESTSPARRSAADKPDMRLNKRRKKAKAARGGLRSGGAALNEKPAQNAAPRAPSILKPQPYAEPKQGQGTRNEEDNSFSAAMRGLTPRQQITKLRESIEKEKRSLLQLKSRETAGKKAKSGSKSTLQICRAARSICASARQICRIVRRNSMPQIDCQQASKDCTTAAKQCPDTSRKGFEIDM